MKKKTSRCLEILSIECKDVMKEVNKFILISNSLKSIDCPSISPSVRPSVKNKFRPEGTFCCSRRLQPSAGARKKPPAACRVAEFLLIYLIELY